MKDFLRNKRKELGLTLEQMANKLNSTNLSTIYQYESGRRFPHATQLIRFAKAYQLTDEELVQWLRYINEENKK